jgi:hypothetical protein
MPPPPPKRNIFVFVALLAAAVIVLLVELALWRAAGGVVGCSLAGSDVLVNLLGVLRSSLFGCAGTIASISPDWRARWRRYLPRGVIMFLFFLLVFERPPCVSVLFGLQP